MNAYVGERTIDGLVVMLNGKPLPSYLDLAKYSAGGFEWGYEGNEPLQLAFAIVYSRLGNVVEARTLAKPMMKMIVANLENEWEIPVDLIDDIIADLKTSYA